MKFAQFAVGETLSVGPTEVTEASILAFARAWDPQWFHTDPAAAARGRFGGLIASGWHTCCIAMRLAVEHALAGSEVVASPGLEHVRWPHPVRPGDRLTLHATITEARRSGKRPELGVLRWHWRMTNQHGIAVLELDATNLFDLGEPHGDPTEGKHPHAA